jgi:hypothetical protein
MSKLTPEIRKKLREVETINPQYDPRAFKAKLSQWQRLAGIKGIAKLALDTDGEREAYTARGKATDSVNLDATGLCPSENGTIDPRNAGSFSMADCARYREHYRGEAFGKSMIRAQHARELEYFRETVPYWPIDGRGKPLTGKSVPEADGYREFKCGFDTVTLRDLRKAHVGPETADLLQDMEEAEELERLRREQEAELAMLPKKLRKMYRMK